MKRAHPDPDRRAAVEQQVLTATERLLASGVMYDDLSVGRIAEAAGIARSTFYLYFGDKQDLIKRLCVKLKQELLGLASGWTPADGVAGLAEVYERMIGYYRPRTALLAAINQVASYDSDVRDTWTATVDTFTDRIADALLAEQSAGRTATDFDAVLAAQVMTWGGDQVIARQAASADRSRDVAVARELAMNRWYGAFRRPPHSAAEATSHGIAFSPR